MRRKERNRLRRIEKRDRQRVFICAGLFTLGELLLCCHGVAAWLGAALYLFGIFALWLACFTSEQLSLNSPTAYLALFGPYIVFLFSELFSQRRITIMDDGKMLAIAFGIGAVLSAMFTWIDVRRKRNLTKLIGGACLNLLISFLIFGFVYVNAVNVQLALQEPARSPAIVLETRMKRSGRGSRSYYAVVEYEQENGERAQSSVRISRSVYKELAPGEQAVLLENTGLFGIRYMEIE